MLQSRFVSPLRGMYRQIRAVPTWSRVALARGRVIACMPARGREGASLLRIHHLAAALRPLGWYPVVLPWTLTLAQRKAMLRLLDPDLVLMQGARHPLNRPGFYPGYRIVYDMDDADFHLPHLAGPVRRAMSQVDAVIAGSDYVARWCREAGAGQTHVIWTGTPVSRAPRPPQSARPPRIAWAQTRPMTYHREADLVCAVIERLARAEPGLRPRLRLYDRRPGDDPGFAERFRRAGAEVEWCPAMPYEAYLASFDDVAVGLAPLCPETPFSRGKSFGKVLAYLDRQVPVVGSDACEHGAFFTAETGVITNDPDHWAAALGDLLARPAGRQAMAGRAFDAFRRQLSIASAARQVDEVLMEFT